MMDARTFWGGSDTRTINWEYWNYV